MGLFALNWGLASAREGKRQKCGGVLLPAGSAEEHQQHEHDSCLYDSSSLQQQRSFYGLHHCHYQQHLSSSPSPNYTVQQQQQQQLFNNLQAWKEEKSRQQQQDNLLSRMNLGGSQVHSLQQQSQQPQLHASNWNQQSDKLNALRSPQRTYPDSRTSSAAHEHLFYKVVTPSDVGKLNRLVIPKQHAERWFPLDPCLRKKGRLLSFQDVVSRELWWFRYSYWSSSQSYVLTKGWIRFVKDKDLQAGDIISFERGSRHELYINCRKRPTSGRAFPLLPGDEIFDHQQQHHSSHLSASSAIAAAPRAAVVVSNKTNETHNLSPQHSSSSSDDEDEAAGSGGTRLFGVDLRANPIHKLAL